MKTNAIKLIVTAFVLGMSSTAHSQIDKASVIRTVGQFRADGNSDNLLRCLDQIERDPAFNESKVDLYVRILIPVIQYLEKHPKPTATPSLNLAPPDGSVSGVDPADVKDPVARAQYEKDIAANNELAEAHRKFAALSAARNKLVINCVLFSNLKAGNEKLVSDLIRTASDKPETTKAVMELMEKKQAELFPRPASGTGG